MNNYLLKMGIAFCLFFCGVETAKFAYTRIPPFSEGECHALKNDASTVKIVENHILEGYSDVELTLGWASMPIQATFEELRQDVGEKVDCK